jgi:hypothetical protein
MKTYKNYIVNNKPLGFNSDAKDYGSVLNQVLESYHPILTKKSMLSGKVILGTPTISVVDGNKSNILATNLIIISPEEKDYFLNMTTIQSYEAGSLLVKFWKIDGYDYYGEHNLSILRKVGINNAVEGFLSLMYEGFKGLVSVSYGIRDGERNETIREEVAYSDILEYRRKNIERVHLNT